MPIIQHITTAMAEALQNRASKQMWSLSDIILLQLAPSPDKQIRDLSAESLSGLKLQLVMR